MIRKTLAFTLVALILVFSLCACEILGEENGFYKKLYEISNSKITLLLTDNKHLEIEGKNLSIKELSYKEICIEGELTIIKIV